jgi:succinate-semialdehyde dehydrogenase/glutarate-semialdehyde dehydrogenase
MNSSSKKEKTISYNPATGEKLGEFFVDSIDNLKKAMESARKAQPAWGALPAKKRVRYVKKMRAYLIENIDEIAEIISRDNGKTRIEALGTELLAGAMALTYYCKKAPVPLKTEISEPGI